MRAHTRVARSAHTQPPRSGHRGDRLTHRIPWPLLEARPVRHIGRAARGPLREKGLFPGPLVVMQGERVDIHAHGLDATTAEWPLVGARRDPREYAILRAPKVWQACRTVI